MFRFHLQLHLPPVEEKQSSEKENKNKITRNLNWNYLFLHFESVRACQGFLTRTSQPTKRWQTPGTQSISTI